MKNNYCLIKSAITLCIAVAMLSGCGGDSKESTDTAVTEGQEAMEAIEMAGDASEENDEQRHDETDPETVSGSTDESAAHSEEESVRSVTIYYVDDISAVVVGEKKEIGDEYDIWDALIDKGVLVDGCHLMDINVNEKDRTIDLNFNAATAEYISSMGTTGETEIVGCIVNTYLEAYDCTGIRLIVDGEEFVTSHGAEFTDYSGRITFE